MIQAQDVISLFGLTQIKQYVMLIGFGGFEVCRVTTKTDLGIFRGVLNKKTGFRRLLLVGFEGQKRIGLGSVTL